MSVEEGRTRTCARPSNLFPGGIICPFRIRPIDKRLQYQIERLIKAAQIAAKQDALLQGGGQSGKKKGSATMDATATEDDDAAAGALAGDQDEGDATRFGPRRDNLVAKAGEAAGKAAGAKGDKGVVKGGEDPDRPGIYRPPKINPVSTKD